MSEYQYIAFEAVDRMLTDKQLDFMHTQSSRADITRSSFANEYHYGDFHGDVDKMLRSGFDVFLHYANYGTRRVALRLPAGMPFKESIWRQYCDNEAPLQWKKDKRGRGGIIDWEPFHDGGSIDQEWNPHEYMDDCIALRDRLIQGDLRALYLIWLCTVSSEYGDWEAIEPPVPHGLSEFAEICGDLLAFFGVDPLILEAASEVTPPLKNNSSNSLDAIAKKWIAKTKLADARKLVLRFLTEDEQNVKAEILAGIRDAQPTAIWPSTSGTRSYEQLRERASELRGAVHLKRTSQTKGQRETRSQKSGPTAISPHGENESRSKTLDERSLQVGRRPRQCQLQSCSRDIVGFT